MKSANSTIINCITKQGDFELEQGGDIVVGSKGQLYPGVIVDAKKCEVGSKIITIEEGGVMFSGTTIIPPSGEPYIFAGEARGPFTLSLGSEGKIIESTGTLNDNISSELTTSEKIESSTEVKTEEKPLSDSVLEESINASLSNVSLTGVETNEQITHESSSSNVDSLN